MLCIAWSSAACVLAAMRIDLVGEHDVGEHGPAHESEAAACRSPDPLRVSVPVMSDGIKSGVN